VCYTGLLVMMSRVGNIFLFVGLLAGVVWAARQHSAPVAAEWLAQHEAVLRRVMDLPRNVTLEFKQTRPADTPDYTVVVLDVVRGERRQEFELPVSKDGQRVRYDGRVVALASPFEALQAKITLDNVPARGPAEAPLTIVEYSDFTCVYCQRFFQNHGRELQARYGGQVRFVYKHFPLGASRPGSEEAAAAAACAFRQGNEPFWRYHDRLFEASERLGAGRPLFLQLALRAGVDAAALRRCLGAGEGARAVARDTDEAEALGVDGTPTFYVNGRPIYGLPSREYFFHIVEEELALAR